MSKNWNLNDLIGFIPDHITNRIKAILIPISNVTDRLIWKFTTDGHFSVKKVTWATIIILKPHPKAENLNNIQKLNLVPKIKLFAQIFLHNALLTRDKLRNICINIGGECPFYHKNEETIGHLFKTCDLPCNVWSIISANCPSPIYSNYILIGLNMFGP